MSDEIIDSDQEMLEKPNSPIGPIEHALFKIIVKYSPASINFLVNN